jgi:hypothetical protein
MTRRAAATAPDERAGAGRGAQARAVPVELRAIRRVLRRRAQALTTAHPPRRLHHLPFTGHRASTAGLLVINSYHSFDRLSDLSFSTESLVGSSRITLR